MDNKDLYDSTGTGESNDARKKNYSDMSVDDLLSVLSGGKPEAEGDDAVQPVAEEAPAEPVYDSYTAAEEAPSEPFYDSYSPVEGSPVNDSYSPVEGSPVNSISAPEEDAAASAPADNKHMSKAEYIYTHFPEAAPENDESAPPPVVSMFDAPSGRTEEEPEMKPEPEVRKKSGKGSSRKKNAKADKGAEARKKEDVKPAPSEKKSVLRRILDEDPEELLNTHREAPEGSASASSGNARRALYTAAGVLFSLLACVGLVSLILMGSRFFGRFSSGDSGKKAMEDVIYPAVIMDIDAFSKPSELTSNQIITAAIWSLVMDKDAVKKYERTFDVITVPATDVETYAVKLFGSELPAFEHGNAGPSEARFYYSEENKSYNIPVRPVTFTYSPRIKSVSRSGNEYTLDVDYMDELPEWVGEFSSKTVRYVLTGTNDGYQIKSMEVLSQHSSSAL